MTANEMITIANQVNGNNDDKLIIKIEERIREKANEGKTSLMINKKMVSLKVEKHFIDNGFEITNEEHWGQIFSIISWKHATPLNDFDYKTYQMESKLKDIKNDF